MGLDKLKTEIKDKFLARGDMLNEIDLARLQLVVRTYLYKVLVAETLDFIGVVSLINGKNMRKEEAWRDFDPNASRAVKDILKFSTKLNFDKSKEEKKESQDGSDRAESDKSEE